jgi:signal transduction histidine kinase
VEAPQHDATSDLLSLRAMPEVAAAVRERSAGIMDKWNAAVKLHLPDADPLTNQEIRDSIPTVLEKIALALELASTDAVLVLHEVCSAHGVARFQQHYGLNELIIEYRLLRRIMMEELHDALAGRLTLVDAAAVDTGVDIALQRGVMTYADHQTAELKSSAEAESKYIAFLSHDLRNNLGAVTLTLKVLSMRLSGLPQFRDVTDDINTLQRSVRETVDGMDRLLQAERLRKEAVQVKLGPVDLHDLANQLLSHLKRQADAKELALQNQVAPGVWAHSDRELLTLALQNLLGNAVKFSARGTIRVSVTKDPLGWRVAVSDEGPGIKPEQKAELFKAFSRGETYGQHGVGLGLTIASHAARLLGSELRVDSQPGAGSTFSFAVPTAKPGGLQQEQAS